MRHIFVPNVDTHAEAPPWRTLLSFGIPIALTGIGGQALLLADRYIIAATQGDAAVGLYAPNYSMANRLVGLIFAPIFGAVYPLLARAWAAGDRGRMLYLIRLVHRAFAIIGGYTIVMFIVFHDQIAAVAVGDEYRSASWILAVIAPATYLWFVGILFHQILEQSENTRAISYLVGIAAALNVGLNLLLVPRYGYPAAAWTTLGTYTVYCVLAYVWPRRTMHLQSKIPWDAYGRVLLLGGLMAGLATAGLDEIPFIGILAVSLVSAALILLVTREPLLSSWRTLVSLRSGRGGA
jgi:O-antigen/teichoic acid export membrane protein